MGKLENDLVDAESTNLDSMIAAYARHRNSLVRSTVLENPNISIDVVQEMLEDKNPEIRWKAEQKLSSLRNPPELQEVSTEEKGFIKCSECHEPTRAGDNFCRNCGNEVSITGPYCTKCNSERESDSLYCRICGDKLLIFES